MYNNILNFSQNSILIVDYNAIANSLFSNIYTEKQKPYINNYWNT
ncbi:hypothetical protein GM3709_3518 [Geminocystis sp. NIES-3709]|nr:hypothetical protein GM3709_3518 [Geminocystis sp. NIES-3709]